jgi:hypothetical protein
MQSCVSDGTHCSSDVVHASGGPALNNSRCMQEDGQLNLEGVGTVCVSQSRDEKRRALEVFTDWAAPNSRTCGRVAMSTGNVPLGPVHMQHQEVLCDRHCAYCAR